MCKKLLVFVLMFGLVRTVIGQVAGVDDPADMADSSGDIKRIEAWVDGGNLNLTMTVYGVFAPSVEETPEGMSNRYYYHWILDTDNNPDTGYLNNEYEGNPTNLETPIGVDVLIQFGWRNGATDGVYAYTLDLSTGDEVELFENYEYTIEGDTIHAVIPLEDLGLELGQTIAVSAFQEGASNDWQVDWVESFELTLAAPIEPAGPKIIYVTSVKDMDQNGIQDDLSWVEWLEAEGYEVDARPGYWTDPLDANDIAELEAADLIIASRGMSTNEYDGAETAKWNAITTPIICTNAWMIRTSRWVWMNSNSANKDAGSPSMLVLDPEHPIFSGIQTDQDGIVEVLDPNVASGNTSFLNDILDAGNGTLLATSVPGVYDTAWIVEWPAGVEYFEGAGQVAGGPRILFMAGTQDDPYTVPDGNTAPVGVLNLNEAGKQMFLNAINYMIPVKPVDPGADGLVAYYALENNANDSSGNGLDGTIVGDPVFVEGAVGMGLQLDGVDDYVDLGNDPLFDLTEQVTLSLWVNTQDIGNTQNNPWLGKGDTSYMIKGHREGNQIEFFIYDGTWITAHADVGPEFNGDWHHAAGTFDGEQLKIYVDGELSVTTDHVGGISPDTYNVAIGTNTQSGGRFSESIVDEAKIYSRALSEGEILYLAGFRAPVDPGTDGLVAHYAFENDTTDSSGNGLDGTIIGDATFAEGVKGMALNLDGDDYVDCGGIDEFSFVDAMTLSTWVNIRSVTTAWMAIAAKGENAWRLAVSNETTTLEYAFSGGTRGWQAATTATELAFDEWYHVAATYDATVGATVYINGVVDASNPDTGGIDVNQFPLLIGDNPEATGRLFDGMLDEIMIYNRALSQEEILFLGQ